MSPFLRLTTGEIDCIICLMNVGFTGTQLGQTDPQLGSLIEIVEGLDFEYGHHGDCLGADEEFHVVLRTVAEHVHIVGHPPKDPKKRAFCDFDSEFDVDEYIVRNHRIVDHADLMIATPKQKNEIKRGSGTWATIRYSRKQKVPLVIIWPDGTCTYEV